MKTSVHQHGELELYSVGDIEPVEFIGLPSRILNLYCIKGALDLFVLVSGYVC